MSDAYRDTDWKSMFLATKQVLVEVSRENEDLKRENAELQARLDVVAENVRKGFFR